MNQSGWRSGKTETQWRNTLAIYAEPILGKLACDAIETEYVLKVLKPIRAMKPETATRVRRRIEAVLSYAKTRGWRDGENPAVWRGHLALVLPARSKVAPVVHHAGRTLIARPQHYSREAGSCMVASRPECCTS